MQERPMSPAELVFQNTDWSLRRGGEALRAPRVSGGGDADGEPTDTQKDMQPEAVSGLLGETS